MGNLHYKNITISGGVAVGKSTLFNNLKPYLKPLNWTFFSGRKKMRTIAIKEGSIQKTQKLHHSAQAYSDSEDITYDKNIFKKITSETHVVIESWLAGFFARNQSNTLRILLINSNKKILADRFSHRDEIKMDDAKKLLVTRNTENFDKWIRLYGKYNFFDKKLYTIVIDTAHKSPEEITKIVLDELGY